MNRVILAAAKDKTFSVCNCACVRWYKTIRREATSKSKNVHLLIPYSFMFSLSFHRFLPFSFYLFHSSFVILLLHPYSIFWSKKNWFCFQGKGGRGVKVKGEQESQPVRLKRRESERGAKSPLHKEETINFITPTSASSISLCALCCLFGSSECCRCHTLFSFSPGFFSFWFCFSLYLVGLELALWLHCLSNPIPLAFSALINSTLNLPSLSLFSSFLFSYPLVLFKNSIPTETFSFPTLSLV